MDQHPHIAFAAAAAAIHAANPDGILVVIAGSLTPLRSAAFGDVADDPRLVRPTVHADLSAALAAAEAWNARLPEGYDDSLWVYPLPVADWYAHFMNMLEYDAVFPISEAA